jgi:cupin 2 domain-containing protein
MIDVRNLFADIPPRLPAEHVTELLSRRGFKIERIVSRGQASPPDVWSDQDRDEWVIVLTGSAGLRFQGETTSRTLRAGDYVTIPAHTRHRVDWTDAEHATIWLAIHYSA